MSEKPANGMIGRYGLRLGDYSKHWLTETWEFNGRDLDTKLRADNPDVLRKIVSLLNITSYQIVEWNNPDDTWWPAGKVIVQSPDHSQYEQRKEMNANLADQRTAALAERLNTLDENTPVLYRNGVLVYLKLQMDAQSKIAVKYIPASKDDEFGSDSRYLEEFTPDGKILAQSFLKKKGCLQQAG